jgi:hypothetical protein
MGSLALDTARYRPFASQNLRQGQYINIQVFSGFQGL